MKYIRNLIETLETVDKKEDELLKIIHQVIETINNKGRILLVSSGPFSTYLDELLNSFDYLFKLGTIQIVPISAQKSYGELDEWKHFENNKSIGVISAMENNVSSNDIVIGFSATGKTEFVNHFLKESNDFGAKTILIVTSGNFHNKEYIKTNIVFELKNKTIDGLYIGNHTTILKVVLEKILFGTFEELGQIRDGKILTTKIWTQKLFDVSFEVARDFKNDITIEEMKVLLKEANNELAVVITMINRKINATSAIKLVEKYNYNFKKILI